MVAEEARCAECGAPMITERRLMPAVGGTWAVVTLPLGCVNPRCARCADTGARSAPPGARPRVS